MQAQKLIAKKDPLSKIFEQWYNKVGKTLYRLPGNRFDLLVEKAFWRAGYMVAWERASKFFLRIGFQQGMIAERERIKALIQGGRDFKLLPTDAKQREAAIELILEEYSGSSSR